MKKEIVLPQNKVETNSYQDRIVIYEKIHAIDENDFVVLVSVVNPERGQIILDACCGYGSVSERLGVPIAEKGLDTKIVLLDSSEMQLERARANLKSMNLQFVLSDARQTPFPDAYFDTIVIKMGLHEVDARSQKQMLKEMYRILKAGGKIVIWELALQDETQPLFSKIIQKKDELAGFDSLVRNRHFPKREEVIWLLEYAGFKNPSVEHDVSYKLSVRNRMDEFMSVDRLKIMKSHNVINRADERKLKKMAEQKISELRDFIRIHLSAEEKILMGYVEKKDDTILNVPKAIFKATKPAH